MHKEENSQHLCSSQTDCEPRDRKSLPSFEHLERKN